MIMALASPQAQTLAWSRNCRSQYSYISQKSHWSASMILHCEILLHVIPALDDTMRYPTRLFHILTIQNNPRWHGWLLACALRRLRSKSLIAQMPPKDYICVPRPAAFSPVRHPCSHCTSWHLRSGCESACSWCLKAVSSWCSLVFTQKDVDSMQHFLSNLSFFASFASFFWSFFSFFFAFFSWGMRSEIAR